MKKLFENKTRTLNDAFTNKSSLNVVLDLFSMGISASLEERINLFKKAFKEDPISTMKTIVYLRDPRDGQGNRDILQIAFDSLSEEQKINFLPYIAEIGSYRDIVKMYEISKNEIVDYAILNLFYDEIINKNNGLAAKWFPRRGDMFKAFAKKFNIPYGKLRKEIVRRTNVVETKMCAKKWHTINYKTVPSLANMKYRKSFFVHDKDRYEEYLQNVVSGKTKMNSSLLYPADLVYNERTLTEDQMQTMFQEMKNTFKQTDLNILPVIDSSGSMSSYSASGSKYKAWDIALGLGIYIANNNPNPEFNKLICDFSSNVEFHILEGSIKNQIRTYKRQCCSTNLIGVFEELLNISEQLESKDLPDILLVVSDMEFNAIDRKFETNYQKIQKMYKEKGRKMPFIVFWRVNVLTPQQPITKNDYGLLINGYSQNFLKIITEINSNFLDNLTPMYALKEAINNPKYDFIEKIF